MSKKYWTETQASSKKDDWEAPQQLFDKLNDRHDFKLGAAATDENARLANYYIIEGDALRQNWFEVGGQSGQPAPLPSAIIIYKKEGKDDSEESKD